MFFWVLLMRLSSNKKRVCFDCSTCRSAPTCLLKTLKQKKKLFIGSVSQFDAHVFFFDFSKGGPCLRCFMPKEPQNTTRCQDDGILGTVTGIAGTIISNELIKDAVGISSSLKNEALIINLENLMFRKIKIKESKNCKNYE